MRVLVAGATGAIGRSLVRRLVHAGHIVFGTTRSPEKISTITDLGAEAVVANGLDMSSVRAAVESSRPEAIIHQMTDLAGATDLRKFDSAFANSNRLRTTGTDHLLAAAREAGVKRFIAQSFCGWPYARIGDAIKSEGDPLDPNPPRELRRTLEAIRHLEGAVTNAGEPEGVVLRYGVFYGPDTGIFDPSFIQQIRSRRVPLIGNGRGWWSFIHVEDAADATVSALKPGATGIYNIVDDDPAPVHEWLPALARMLGAKPPLRVPAWIARIVAGEHLVTMMTEARAGTNAKAKRELGWRPGRASWRQGFSEIVELLRERAEPIQAA